MNSFEENNSLLIRVISLNGLLSPSCECKGLHKIHPWYVCIMGYNIKFLKDKDYYLCSYLCTFIILVFITTLL